MSIPDWRRWDCVCGGSFPWYTSHGRSLLVGVVLPYQWGCVEYAALPPSWDQPRRGDRGRMLEMSCGLCWEVGWDPGGAKRSKVEREVGSHLSAGFSFGFSPSCQRYSADDSQGWDTSGNKAGTPKGPQ